MDDSNQLRRLLLHVLQSLHCPLKAPLAARLLGAKDPRVQAFLHRQTRQRKSTRRAKENAAYLHRLTSREHEALNSVKHSGLEDDLVADVSQSVGRVPHARGGLCPTLTPGSKCMVLAVKRAIIPEEKLLLGGIPLRRLQVPSSLSPQQIASLGGNLMHCEAIAAAVLLGLSILQVDKLRPGPPRFPAAGRAKMIEVNQLLSAQNCPTKTNRRRRVAANQPCTKQKVPDAKCIAEVYLSSEGRKRVAQPLFSFSGKKARKCRSIADVYSA